VKFEELSEQHGGERQIPNDVLYGYLDTYRGDLINEAKLGVDRIPQSRLGKEVRRRSKQDLMWLAGYFTWETNPHQEGWKPISHNMILEKTHAVICRDFFIQKDDAKSVKEQSSIKFRTILWSRGGLKTTCDIADSVQWILNFPSIRIWFITAADDLAVGILDELKSHFLIKVDAPTLMNLFFPEFCVEEKNLGNQFEFTCPVWAAKQIKRKEPTVYASSVTATASGWHFEVIKGDDVVSDRNSENDDMCRKIIKQFSLRKKTLLPKGYIDLVGTRYHDADLYGADIERAQVGELQETKGTGWVLTHNIEQKSLFLIGKAMQIKPEVIQKLEAESRPVSYKEAGEEGVILLLPEYLTYSDLCGQFAENESTFESQMNQNPRPTADATFDRPLLLRNTVPFTQLPETGPITQIWDFAFSQKKGRDFSTGSSVIWGADGTMNVHDIVRQRFKPDDLANAVVEFALKWRPFKVGIESAGGSRLLEPAIIAAAYKTKDQRVIEICTHIDWFTPDNQNDAKRIRMAALHPWMVAGRLKFANYLPHLEVLYSEFERCLTNHHHEDIPDSIAQHPRYAPAMAMAHSLEDDEKTEKFTSSDPAYNLLYGTWLSEDGSPADAFGNLGAGQPTPFLETLMEPESEDWTESLVPDMPNILGGGLIG
jgi:phage terminase large subunit-like protein